MKYWLYLMLAILTEVVATSALKASAGFSRPLPSLIVVAGYAISFYAMSLALEAIPVGIAYAVWSGIGIVLITVAAWFLYGQRLDVWALIGIGFIIVGVVILNLLSKVEVR
ncbi:MAG: multidrug SMR transporter [Chloroflexus sp.]|jgi:small multidrug resistance pump|uniref:Small multidrug resistance protein n=1 Tax=Chloroflexus aurantiacus (strain ATCC 29366 / DSM 635 / J-10-fl) TaxID=324602 RepID=A9WD30_CHLAA|nr:MULTISPECIES: multidrug efflux SMR transporter [Chloroflexus]RMG52177.1 MAG: QacE family quaternary ammonium compound efflux SMR transporter [Chloroflexota bacterium]ABY34997.1 small multidrug resistance protein [Chloroflexus aurantiacus J-10-fl]GIV87434.1 MAG: multidrug SMR transporter [Chloroflexus sp.]GIV92620.1 MAG: multidrug SMR transporter [Chloroflexus sp.]HBW68791.1 QacE family quaternary ammonium compound efflux SMR transporter [Chloroflexus aurantiacus]